MFEQFIGTKPVEERHRIDAARSRDFSASASRGDRAVQGRPVESDLQADAPTARRTCCAASRPGKLLPSAHAVDREFRVMRGARTAPAFPVAAHVRCCARTRAVIGTRVLRHGVRRRPRAVGPVAARHDDARARRDLRRDEPRDRGAAHASTIARSASRTTASRATTSSARSRAGRKQYQASETEPIEAMDRLIDWLPQNIPPATRRARAIVHGDYRLDNLIFHPTEPRILAVLDWELSTLGHPLADFAYHCMAGTSRRASSAASAGSTSPRSASRRRRATCSATASAPAAPTRSIRPTGTSTWPTTCSASPRILQGIAKRVVDGTASSAQARDAGARAHGRWPSSAGNSRSRR